MFAFYFSLSLHFCSCFFPRRGHYPRDFIKIHYHSIRMREIGGFSNAIYVAIIAGTLNSDWIRCNVIWRYLLSTITEDYTWRKWRHHSWFPARKISRGVAKTSNAAASGISEGVMHFAKMHGWYRTGSDKMLIKEYRIPLPLTVEEYRIAQLYMIAVIIVIN